MGSSFLLIHKLELTMFPSLAPPVAFNSVTAKFSISSGILKKKRKKFKQRNLTQLWMVCSLRFGLHITSSGTEKRVRFFRYSPSSKVMFPRTGRTSPDSAGSKTHKTDTSPKWPLFLITGYKAEGETGHTDMINLDIECLFFLTDKLHLILAVQPFWNETVGAQLYTCLFIANTGDTGHSLEELLYPH